MSDPWQQVLNPLELPVCFTSYQQWPGVVGPQTNINPAAPMSADRQAQALAAIQAHQEEPCTTPDSRLPPPVPPPTVTSVSPTNGGAANAITITLTGTGFTGATEVLFGTTPGTAIHVTSDTSMTAVCPALAASTVDVSVVTPGGTGTLPGAYTYWPQPNLTGINPNTGLIAGGEAVTISGTHLTGATSALFGGRTATAFVVVNDSTITCNTPSQPSAGAVNVGLLKPRGNGNSLNNGFTYS